MRGAGHALGHVDAQHLRAKAAETGNAGAHFLGLVAGRDQGQARLGQRQAGLADARRLQRRAPARRARLQQAGMIEVEHADIDAGAAQQMALILVEMAERRIKVESRRDAAGIGQLGEDRADDGGHGRIGSAFAHLDQRQQMLLLLRLEPGRQTGRHLLLHIRAQRGERAIEPDFGREQACARHQRCDRGSLPGDARRLSRIVHEREIRIRSAHQFVSLHS